MAFTKLHKCTCEDEKLGALADENPYAGLFWFLLLAAGGPWGRYPANPRKLKVRVCPFVDNITPSKIEKIVVRLEELGMVRRYACAWSGEECIACTHWSKYNDAGRQYHKMIRPEFSPPPGWEPPADLVKYLRMVNEGRYSSKKAQSEAEKFGVSTEGLFPGNGTQPDGDTSQGNIPETVPRDSSQGNVPERRPRDTSPRRRQDVDVDGDGDGDGVTTNDDDVSCAREARSGEPAGASALVGVASRAGGNGNDERHVPSRAAWIAMHGPPPQDQTTDQAVYYGMARNAYLAGEKGPNHGFDFPGQEVTTNAASAG